MLDVKRSDSECYVPGDFTSLIRNTLSCPVSAVFDNRQPDETRRHQVLCSAHPEMRKSVVRIEYATPQVFRYILRRPIHRNISLLWQGKRIFFSCNAYVPELTKSRSTVSFSCAVARVWSSTDFPISSMRERASATLLSRSFI